MGPQMTKNSKEQDILKDIKVEQDDAYNAQE